MAVSGTVAAAVGLGAATAAAVAAAGHYIHRREDLKAGDQEIEQERSREREIEKQMESCHVPARGIIHFTHSHPLNEVCWSSNGLCNSCDTTCLGWGYQCDVESCNFKLHKECAQMKAPVTLSPMMSPLGEMPVMAEAKTVSTFAHQPHPVSEMYSNSGYCCNHCNTSGYGRRYRCVECKVDMHPVCTENPARLSTFMHPKHELALKTKPHSKKCDLCGHHTTGTSYRVYRCKECKFYLHPACSQLPQYLSHGLHPHFLVLKLMSHSSPCDAPECKHHCKKWRYHCSHCNVSIHVECILRSSLHGHSDKIEIKDKIQVFAIADNIVDIAKNIADMCSTPST
ncbi:hypothetical protein Ancab_017084 [Ancistrocladus abbreviatus]